MFFFVNNRTYLAIPSIQSALSRSKSKKDLHLLLDYTFVFQPVCLRIKRNDSLRSMMEVFSGPSLQAALVQCACQHPVGS